MATEVDGGRLEPKRDTGDKTPILQRLARIEGQVRGLRVMVENGRETSEQIQPGSAVIAALREVALLSIRQEIQAQLTEMGGASGDIQGIVELLRATFRLA